MKKTLCLLMTTAAVMLSAVAAFAETVITAPIDSRPISYEYLGNLVELGGDEFIAADKANLDFFSSNLSDSYFGNSQKVRENIYNLVSQNNKKSTTVILNSSSYITNGLVGSRCGKNYAEYKSAMQDLKKLLTENPEPIYYFNLSMPRSLPETRFNTIWREEDCPDLLGIGYFYAQNNPDTEDCNYIKRTFGKVNPSQFLLEYGYVENKAQELGERNLTKWELEFLRYFRSNFLNKQPYKTYIADYQKPYKAAAEIFGYLLDYQKQGLLDEIIVSNDDLQLPSSITYFYGKNADWVQLEKGTPIKYSFPRTMLVSDYNSIYSRYDRVYGSRERSYGVVGMGKNVNFIFGTDEVPQLIYARSLSQRENLTANFEILANSANRIAGAYDVTNIMSLLECSENFVSAGSKETNRVFSLYLYNYNHSISPMQFLGEMKKSYNKGNNIGLIEIYNSSANNILFKTMLTDNKAYPSVNELSSYSAWNTNGNAIGLGVAHSQVFAITEQADNNPSVIVNAQLKMLAQHIYEDGIYTAQTKRTLSNEGYKPTAEEKVISTKLLSMLENQPVNLKDRTYRVGNKEFVVNKLKLTSCGFPWCRTFDCYLDFEVETEKA